MPPRRAGSASGRCRCRRVRAGVLDRRGRLEEQRRLAREMEELLRRSRQLGRTAFTRVLWQAINYGVEQGVLQVYTRPDQLPPPPPPHADAAAGAGADPAAAAAAPPPPPRGATPEPLNCRSEVPSTEQPRLDTPGSGETSCQARETAAGLAGVTRVAFHPSPEGDRSDAVVRAAGAGTANRGTGSPASVGVLRRLLSFVLFPLKALMWPLQSRRASVCALELPAADTAAAAEADGDGDGDGDGDSGDKPNPNPDPDPDPDPAAAR